LNIDFEKNEICSGQIKTSFDVRRGEPVKLRIFQDRTTMEIFFKDYQRYVPFPAVINPDDHSVSLSVTGGESGVVSADLFEMKSSWTPEARARR
jgi:sucrose-6-phosphate hydrolase SacC (GH32 family)